MFRSGFIGIVLMLLLMLGCNRNDTLFSTVPTSSSGIGFVNQLNETDSININEYLYAYNGGGVGVGDFNKDGLPDIYFTGNQVANKLYINQGNFQFIDATQKAGVQGLIGSKNWTTGVTVADVNADGWLDIYVSQVADGKRFEGHNLLFINNTDGTFTEKAKDYGLDLKGYGQQALFFDYDGDGDLDMFQLNHSVHEADVYVKAEKRTVRDSLSGDRLLQNNNGYFHDVSELAGIYGGAIGYGLSALVTDVDNNGCPDIYVSNDFHDNDYLYYNQCDGTFKEGIANSMDLSSNFSMGSDAADMNNDGLIDVMTLDMKPEKEVIRKSSAGEDPYYIYEYKKSFGFGEQSPRNMLQLNQGNISGHTRFSELARYAGVEATDWSWSVLLADYDNDGHKDIYITNGILRRPNDLDYIKYDYPVRAGKVPSLQLAQKMPEGKVPNYAYKNEGSLKFKNVGKEWGLDLTGCSMGAAYADFDNDGDLDLVLNNLNAPSTLYKNNAETTQNNYLKVKLEGSAENPYGVGAKVEVKLKEQTLVQEMYPVRGWLSSSEHALNFGLGKNPNIAYVQVQWPDGMVQKSKNVSVNGTLVLKYKEASEENRSKKEEPTFFVPVDSIGLDFVHQENKFIDFNVETLIPHKLSTEGPALCIGDVNGDGLEDVFVGGASGQASRLFLQKQTEDGFHFEKMGIPAFEQDKMSEDVDAVFFDADGNGDLDLYVVAGSGEAKSAEKNRDRLYKNSGGKFQRDDSVPNIISNGSVVVAEDFDDDGDIDLFIGSRSVPGSYGLSPKSHMLWNNGDNGFESDQDQVLSQLGMVTDAVWDQDQKVLWVVGEWMPITKVVAHGKKITLEEIPKSNGWWNAVDLIDTNNDGTEELLLGNLGSNSGLEASSEHPLKLWVKDWDGNGQVDPILVQYKDGKDRVFSTLDELKRQMPFMGRVFNKYASFANKSADEIFTSELRENAISLEVFTLQSQILYRTESDSYEMKPLPGFTQMAPINDFEVHDYNGDGIKDVVYVGNFSGLAPSIGRINSSMGGMLLGDGNGFFKEIHSKKSGLHSIGNANFIKNISLGKSNGPLIGLNSGKLQFYRINP
ncbi:VCBS repeat-containing protein [Flagellimonas profundi]|uniref:VCBS repeat-containing protein n=1 Tax=Flagellimonas profundi TaxID=2915620 RepID=A0ABS3FJD4_9FLAO|nr:VCBS repeat-containing protein [Allomuricauda profundi]MBO0343307.1 VCBS repeat-containing protein [Allomuricauda profundi]